MLERGKLEAMEDLLSQIVTLAQERGIRFGCIQVMDSVHSTADVNPDKDRERQNQEDQPPRDGDAQWGVKGSRRVRDTQGNQVKVPDYFFGYKTHCSLNAEAGLITSLRVTPGNAHDGHQLPELLASDLAQGLPVDIVSADRAYDDGNNHFLLQSKGIHSAIRLNDYRTQKKDANREVWLSLKAMPEYERGLQERYTIERKFGEGKRGHGWGRCRYVGLLRYGLQAFLTAMVLNLKRIVKLVVGVPFKEAVRLAA